MKPVLQAIDLLQRSTTKETQVEAQAGKPSASNSISHATHPSLLRTSGLSISGRNLSFRFSLLSCPLKATIHLFIVIPIPSIDYYIPFSFRSFSSLPSDSWHLDGSCGVLADFILVICPPVSPCKPLACSSNISKPLKM